MKQLWLTAKLDIVESLRARWFQIYTLVFGGIVALLFLFGLTESRVLGFIGLSRLLVTYIQLTMAILPIFVLITTVRSVAGDREAGVFEYLLSLPVSLSSWYWGRLVGRFFTVFLPVFLAMLGAALWATFKDIEVPWRMFGIYTGQLAAMSWCFLGLDLGGGKAVIIGDPATQKTEALLRAYGRFVQSLNGRYFTACDVGTFSPDMDYVARECDFVTGRTVAHGGAGDSSVLTASGVFQAMRAAAEQVWGEPTLSGRTVGIAGAGKVGRHLAG